MPLQPIPQKTLRKPYSPTTLRQLIKLERDLAQVRARRKSAFRESSTAWSNCSLVQREIETLQQRLMNFRGSLRDLQTANLTLEQSNSDLTSRNQSILQTLHTNRSDLTESHRETDSRTADVEANRATLKKKREALRHRQRELISNIHTIYPIHTSPSGRVFITEIWLPAVDQHANCDDMTLSASLGYAVHLTILLSKILNIPLRYPLKFFCSMSSITDPVSAKLLDRERECVQEVCCPLLIHYSSRLIDWLMNSCFDWLIDWMIDWLIDELMFRLIDWLIDWLIF